MLDMTCVRPKLVTISACISSAAIAVRSLDLSGPVLPTGGRWSNTGLRLAKDLAIRLGCSVATFRFPVTDDFALAYFLKLYRFLIASKQPLPRAMAMTLQNLRGQSPALSLIAPALYGIPAADLQLSLPGETVGESPPGNMTTAWLSGAPPERFVGRDDVMRQAADSLAIDSGSSGVLLHGMPGIGKTSMARELAFTRDSLDPDNRFLLMIAHEITRDVNGGIGMTLPNFMDSLHARISGFPSSEVLKDEQRLRSQLPFMTEYFEQKRCLVVLENVEIVLHADGRWRNNSWGISSAP